MSRIDRGTDAKVDQEARTRASGDSRRTDILRRLRAGSSRRKLVFLACVFALGLVGVAIAGPSGSLIPGSGGTERGLIKAGPANTDNGFPDWYRDSNKLDLEPCLDPGDICAAPPTPDPEQPASLVDGNFPDEFFYMLADANMTANGGNDVLAEFALEGAFNAAVAPGEQIVFGRIRYRVRGGLQPDSDYKIIQPYGTDTVHTDANSTELFVTQDVGVAAGDFNSVMTSRIGPFLTWAPNASDPTDVPPAGYVGDGVTPHAVTGSALGTNFVRIEGPGIGGPGNPNPCPDPAADDPQSLNCIYTDLFTLVGKKSTRAGVDVARATYSRSADGATKQLDVFAGSKEGQNIAVQQAADVPATPRQFVTTPLRPEGESYFAHLDITGDIPAKVDVVNRGDTPQTVKHVTVTDQVTGSAVYHNAAASADPTAPGGSLHVEAASSDRSTGADAPVLTVLDQQIPAGGQIDIPLTSPTSTVEVTSSKGGSAQLPVTVDGPGMAPLSLTANAGPDQTVEQGATVQLNGNGSTGTIDGYSWTSADGIALDGADTATPTFTAPSQAGDYTFTLTVNGVDGTPPAPATSTDQLIVHVNEVTTPTARIQLAGTATDPATPVTVPQNLPVTLDASTSTGALKFQWTQVGGPPVTLSGANTAKATFTFPKTTDDVKLQLEVRNSSDAGAPCDPTAATTTCDITTVTLRGEPDTITPGKVRFDPDQSRWQIDGTATSTKQNKVTVYSGRTADPARKIGTSDVDNLNAWAVDARDSTVPLDSCACVLMVSDRGGEVTAPLEKADQLPIPPAPAPTTQAATANVAPLALAAPRGVAAAAPAVAAVPLVGAARLAVAGLAVTGVIAASAVAVKGISVTLTAPAGAKVVRVRVLKGKKALLTKFHRVKAGKRARFRVRSKKLAHKLRHGRRYRLEVRAGKNRRKLGKATVRTFRVR